MDLSRRALVGLSAATAAVIGRRAAFAQPDRTVGSADSALRDAEAMQVVQRGGLFAELADPNVHQLPPEAFAQRFIYSPAPKANPPGQWVEAAPLPIPRSEMAWAVAEDDRMHVIGGYGKGQVARTYHHVYDGRSRSWRQAAPIPRGANHIGVAASNGVIYAFGGFVGRNVIATPDCYAYDIADDRWRAIQPLSRGSRGAISAVVFGGLIHAIGGRDTRSVDWHEVYDPHTDRWASRAPIPGPRDHTAAVAFPDRISVVGGRMDTFDFNTGMHVAYDPASDKWEERAPMPTPRSGHGGVLYRGRLFCMGGEGTRRVFGQNEAYDPTTDSWEAFTPLPTPRHGMGAAVLGEAIHVAGGGPMNGGSFQTSIHKVFTL